jgi:hypothetical protein
LKRWNEGTEILSNGRVKPVHILRFDGQFRIILRNEHGSVLSNFDPVFSAFNLMTSTLVEVNEFER